MNDLMIVHVIHSLKGGVATVAMNLIKKTFFDNKGSVIVKKSKSKPKKDNKKDVTLF